MIHMRAVATFFVPGFLLVSFFRVVVRPVGSVHRRRRITNSGRDVTSGAVAFGLNGTMRRDIIDAVEAVEAKRVVRFAGLEKPVLCPLPTCHVR